MFWARNEIMHTNNAVLKTSHFGAISMPSCVDTDFEPCDEAGVVYPLVDSVAKALSLVAS